MNFRKLDLNLLRVFDTIFTEGSTKRAAGKLGMSQPAVSNALTRLRQQLDDPLFERAGQKIAPTDRARALAPQIREALATVEKALVDKPDFDPASSRRHFTMLIPDAVEPQIMRPLLDMRAGATPNLSYRLMPLVPSNPVEQILAKEVDLAILVAPVDVPFVRSSFLFHDGASIVARAGHPRFAGRDRFTLEDMREAEFVALDENARKFVNLERETLAKGIERRFACETKSIWSILHLASATDLVAAVPTSLAQMMAPILNLVVFEPPLQVPLQNWHMAWHSDLHDDPGHIWLRRQVDRAVNGTTADERSDPVPADTFANNLP